MVGYVSVSISPTTSIGTLAYHIFQSLRQNNLWKNMPKLNLKFKKPNTKQKSLINDPTESMNLDQLRELGWKTCYSLPTVAS